MAQDLFYHCDYSLRNNVDGYLNRNEIQFTILKVLFDYIAEVVIFKICHHRVTLSIAIKFPPFIEQPMVHWWNLFAQLHMTDTYPNGHNNFTNFFIDKSFQAALVKNPLEVFLFITLNSNLLTKGEVCFPILQLCM